MTFTARPLSIANGGQEALKKLNVVAPNLANLANEFASISAAARATGIPESSLGRVFNGVEMNITSLSRHEDAEIRWFNSRDTPDDKSEDKGDPDLCPTADGEPDVILVVSGNP